MSAPTAPSFAIIEVPGCGMRLRAMKDEGGWSISGWRRAQGAKAMVMFAAADTTPTFSETAGQHHVIAGRTYIALPPASQKKLQAFIASTEGASVQGGAA
ncbi:hypothetical protein ACQ5SB_20570 [Stenotrophomonas geniculata]|uniref:hypothetical protein n=1 Tax=Stenotrophomonas TaxID=40323 RepID=UPI003D33BBD5